MVSQTNVNRGVNGTNGRQGLLHHVTEFASDCITLFELQIQLFLVDGKEGFAKIITPVVVLLASALLLLCCVPLAMALSVVGLVEGAGFSYLPATALALGIWLSLGGLVGLLGIYWMRSRWQLFERSFTELQSNAIWVKSVLKRLAGGNSPDSAAGRF